MSEAEGATRVRRRGHVLLPNETVYDSSISYAALGILAILLARPEEAPKGYRNLLRPDAGVGADSVRRALRELVAAGYRHQFLRTTSSTRGRPKVVTDTYVTDQPLTAAEFRTWHREATGLEPIEVPDRTKTKDTLARVSVAHKPEAHNTEAHKPGAQTKAFAGSSKLSRENQGGADAPEAPEAPAQAKRTASAASPNGRVSEAISDAADASNDERVHCLACDRTYYRDELNERGQCPTCVAQLRAAEDAKAAAAQLPSDPAEVARLAAAAKRASIERQAKRLHITVDELLAKRQPRT